MISQPNMNIDIWFEKLICAHRERKEMKQQLAPNCHFEYGSNALSLEIFKIRQPIIFDIINL